MPEQKTMTIRLPVDLKRLIDHAVVTTGMSQNSWVIAACIDRLKEASNEDKSEKE